MNYKIQINNTAVAVSSLAMFAGCAPNGGGLMGNAANSSMQQLMQNQQPQQTYTPPAQTYSPPPQPQGLASIIVGDWVEDGSFHGELIIQPNMTAKMRMTDDTQYPPLSGSVQITSANHFDVNYADGRSSSFELKNINTLTLHGGIEEVSIDFDFKRKQ